MQTVSLSDEIDTSISSKKTLILGIGNILKKDDGVGVFIANYLEENYPELSESVDIIDGGTAGFDLIEYMAHRERIIVIDALLAESPPGSIYHFNAQHLSDNSVIYSQHQVGLAKIIDMMKVMGHDPTIEIIGIVPGDIDSSEIGLSPEVASSVSKAALLVKETVFNNIDGGL